MEGRRWAGTQMSHVSVSRTQIDAIRFDVVFVLVCAIFVWISIGWDVTPP